MSNSDDDWVQFDLFGPDIDDVVDFKYVNGEILRNVTILPDRYESEDIFNVCPPVGGWWRLARSL